MLSQRVRPRRPGRGAALTALVFVIVALAPSAAGGAQEGRRGSQSIVTIAARPSTVAPDHPITLYGTIPSRRSGEHIGIQTKECGQSFFRSFASTHSALGGSWSAEFFPGITTRVRAVWNGRASRAIVVRQRAMLRFAPKASDRTRFVVSVVARAQFWQRTVVIERLGRSRSRWAPYRSVRLTQQEAPGEWVWTSGEFTARLPKGTLLRAVLPESQAGPCYLMSYSRPVRTD